MAGLTFNIFGHDVSASSALRRVEGQADRSARNIGGHFRRMGGMVAGALGGLAVGSFLKDSLDEATEAQKVGAQTAAVLKSTGNAAKVSADQIGDLATKISAKAGIDDEAIQSGENLLLTFTQIRNEAGKGNDIFDQTTQIMTDLSVATGQSMKTSAIQLGKALNDPVTGMTKLAKVGVSFTAQQKATNKALVEGGDVNALNAMGYKVTGASLQQLAKQYGGSLPKAVKAYTDEMTASQKKQFEHLTEGGHTVEAQKNILKELNKEFKGSAEAQATPAEKAKVAWGNLKETIGTYLLPIVAKLSTFVTTKLIPAIQMAVEWVAKHKEGFKSLGRGLVEFGKGVFDNVIKPLAQFLIPIVKSVINWIKQHREGLAQFAKVLAGVVVTAIKVAVGTIKLMVGSIKLGVSIIKTAASAIVTAFEAVGAGVKWVWQNLIKPQYDAIKSGIRAVRDVVKTVASAIVTAFKGVGAGLKWTWQNVIRPVYGWIKDGIRLVRDVAKNVGTGVSNAFKSVGNGLAWAWRNVIGPVFGWVKDGVRGVRRIVGPVVSGISNVFKRVGNGLKYAWDHTLGPVFGAIVDTVKWVQDAITSLIGGNGTFKNSKGGSPLSWGQNAQGTGFWSGGRTLVGERGPELVTLPRGARISSASTTTSMVGAGGGSTHVHVHFSGMPLVDQTGIERAVVSAVNNGINKGQRITAPPGAIRVR